MDELWSTLAAVVTAAGVLAGLVVLAATARGPLALRVALELWTAAGLLRLVGPPDWQALVTVAVVLALRQVVGRAQRHPAARGGSQDGGRGGHVGGGGDGPESRVPGGRRRPPWRALVAPQWAADHRTPGP